MVLGDAQPASLPRGPRALRVCACDRRVLAGHAAVAAQLDARARRVRRRARAVGSGWPGLPLPEQARGKLRRRGSGRSRSPARSRGSAGPRAAASRCAPCISKARPSTGSRSLLTVVAERPGSTNATPIVIVAHRDAAARGSRAELSGTAVLLELARVFAARETERTIILVSTSGGSGGDAGAAGLTAELARTRRTRRSCSAMLPRRESRKPLVVPFSDGFGSAPLQLQRTVADAITQRDRRGPGSPSALGQLAHLVFPLDRRRTGAVSRPPALPVGARPGLGRTRPARRTRR